MKRKGYLVPDDPEPEDNFCFPVFIPKDEKYLVAFFGALEWMGKWVAWDDGGDGRAALAGARWKLANELTHTAFAAGGCVTTPQFRVNDDCLLEVNCSDDPEAPDWKTIITQLTDPRTDIEYPPPYPGEPPEGQSNECLAAANLAEFVWYAGGHLAERLGTGAIITEIVVAMAGIVATFFQLLTTIIVDETLILFVNISPGTIDDDWLTLDKQDFIDLVSCYLDDSGELPVAYWGEFLDELLALAAGNQAWYLVYYVCVLMGVGGFNLAAVIGGVTEAECAECVEEWEHIFDFAEGAQGWTSDIDGHGHIACQLVGGVFEVYQAQHDGSDNQYYYVGLNRAIGAAANITEIEYDGTVSRGVYDVPFVDSIRYNGGTLEDYDNTTQPTVNRLWDGSQSMTSIYVIMTVGWKFSGGTVSGSGGISKITIRGTGTDPF